MEQETNKIIQRLVRFVIIVIWLTSAMLFLEGGQNTYKLISWNRVTGTYERTEKYPIIENSSSSDHSQYFLHYYTFNTGGGNFNKSVYDETGDKKINQEEEILYNPANPEDSMLLSSNDGISKLLIATICAIAPAILLFIIYKKYGRDYLISFLTHH
jgi:hypothetical protein